MCIRILSLRVCKYYHDSKAYLLSSTEILEDSNGKQFWIKKSYTPKDQLLKRVEIGVQSSPFSSFNGLRSKQCLIF